MSAIERYRIRLWRAAHTAVEAAKIYLEPLPSDCDPETAVDLAFRSHVIRPNQVRSELLELARLVYEKRPKAFLEIGTFNGGTFFVFCRVADPSATVISLDLPGGNFGGGPARFRGPLIRRLKQRGQQAFILRADSHKDESRRRIADILGSAKLDLLFIDADHTYAGVKRDFDMYAPFVREGGMVCFHDILRYPSETGCEVERFWTEIKATHRHREIVESPDQGWAGIGVLLV